MKEQLVPIRAQSAPGSAIYYHHHCESDIPLGAPVFSPTQLRQQGIILRPALAQVLNIFLTREQQKGRTSVFSGSLFSVRTSQPIASVVSFVKRQTG